jgi:uncharacterized protein YodC (DUF2158 family)
MIWRREAQARSWFSLHILLSENLMLHTTTEVAEKPRVATAGIGDVVTLKSGGPRMTVMHAGPVSFASGHWLICQWFDDHGDLRQDMFEQGMVQIEPRSVTAASVKMRGVSRAVGEIRKRFL